MTFGGHVIAAASPPVEQATSCLLSSLLTRARIGSSWSTKLNYLLNEVCPCNPSAYQYDISFIGASIFSEGKVPDILQFPAITFPAEAARKAAELEKKRQAELAERQRESMAQAKLRAMGVCVAGYRWIKQDPGYRCAGGTHWVSDSQLGL